jgi:hypothetical protein
MAVLMVMLARAAVPPTLLVLPLDMTDASGEIPPHTEEHEQRVTVLTDYLSKALTDQHMYTIINRTPSTPLSRQRAPSSLYRNALAARETWASRSTRIGSWWDASTKSARSSAT